MAASVGRTRGGGISVIQKNAEFRKKWGKHRDVIYLWSLTEIRIALLVAQVIYHD